MKQLPIMRTYKNNTEVRTLHLGVDGKNYFFTDWTSDMILQKLSTPDYVSAVNTNPSLLSLYVEYRFLNRNAGTLRVQGFDLFNQNTGISRTVNGTTITDAQNKRLGRYFLLSFNLRLQKFAGSRKYQKTPGERNQNRMRGEMRGGGNRNGGGKKRNDTGQNF